MSWRLRARCRELIEAGEASPEWWFSCSGLESRRAREICQSCPVREECAIEGASELGIWGGLNAKERRGLADRYRHCTRCGVSIPGRIIYCGSCALEVRRDTKARSREKHGVPIQETARI